MGAQGRMKFGGLRNGKYFYQRESFYGRMVRVVKDFGFFAHTGIQRKYVSWNWRMPGATGRGKSPLLDFSERFRRKVNDGFDTFCLSWKYLSFDHVRVRVPRHGAKAGDGGAFPHRVGGHEPGGDWQSGAPRDAEQAEAGRHFDRRKVRGADDAERL